MKKHIQRLLSGPLPGRAALLVVLAFPCLAAGQAPSFRAHTTESVLSSLRLDQFSTEGVIHLSGKDDKVFAADNLVELRREGSALPDYPPPPFLALTSGERLPLAKDGALDLKERRLHFTPAAPLQVRGESEGDREGLRVPAPYLAAICLDYPGGAEPLESRLGRLLRGWRKLDKVFLIDGDEIEGKVVELAGKECKVEASGRTVSLPLARVALILFSSERLIPPRVKGAAFIMTTRQGARVTFQRLEFVRERSVFSGKTAWGGALDVPLADFICLRTRSPKVTYLSEVEPLRFAHHATFGWSWPLGRDRSFLGHGLHLTDGLHTKGLSIPPGSQVTYALGGAYRWLDASVGLDADDGKLGRARLEVLVNGKAAAGVPDKELTIANGPWDLRIDLSKAKTLSLGVHSGSRSVVEAVVNWGDARLIR